MTSHDPQPTTASPVGTAARLGVVVPLGAGVLVLLSLAPALGFAAASALADPGALVRWSLPVLTVAQTVLAAATVGLLGLAAFLVPERRSTSRRDVAVRLATRTAALWFGVAVCLVVVTFADIAGVPLFGPGFVDQFFAFVWSVQITRVLDIHAALVALVLVLLALDRRRPTIAWALAAALAAVAVLGLNGHAAGSSDHENAVNSIAVHVLAATVWLGGLIAVTAMRRVAGGDLPPVVERFSTVAAWCFAAIALSGLVQATLALDAWRDLGTAYGLTLLAKVVVLGALGAAGWQQRRAMIGRLRANAGDQSAFARLVVGELVLLGVAAGLGAALSRSAPPVEDTSEPSVVLSLSGYPDPGPMRWTDWLSAWRFDWLLLAVGVVAIGVYLAGVRRLRARGDAWPLWRPALWAAGWLVWIWATNGAPAIWGRVTFSTHMVMHMVVAMFVPLLLVPAAPITLALRAIPARRDKTWGPRELVLELVHSRALRVLANPVVAAGLFFVSLALFYYSPAFELALSTHTGHMLMLAHFLLTGYLFTWVLIGTDPGPPRWSPLVLLVVLFVTVSFHAFFGVILTGQQTLLAPDFFQRIALPWLPDLMADQKRAGEIAWGTGELPTVILAFLVARQWFARDKAESVRRDRQADRDGDAELTAYNEMLAARRAQAERDSRSDEAPVRRERG